MFYISIALIAALLIRLRFFLILFLGGLGRGGGRGPAGAEGGCVVVGEAVSERIRLTNGLQVLCEWKVAIQSNHYHLLLCVVVVTQ